MPFIFFQISIYLFLKFLDFMICNDAMNKYAVEKEKIKMVDERGRDKCKWWKKGGKGNMR
jgi:hypothetical protein